MAAAGKPKSSLFAPSGFSFTSPAPAATSQPSATSVITKESEKKDLFASSGFKFDLAPRKNATADANVKPLKRRKYVAKTAAVPQQTTVVHLNENKMATWKKRHRELMGKAGAVGAGAGAPAAAPAQLKPRARATASAPAEKGDGEKKSEKESEKKSSGKAKLDAEGAAQASTPVVAPTVTTSTELPAPGAPLFPAAANKTKRERIRSMPLVRTIKKPAAKAPPKPKTAEELAADKKAAKKKNKRDRQKQRAKESPEDAAKAKTTQSPAKAAAKPAASSPAGGKSAAASPVTKGKTPAKAPATAQAESPKKGKKAAAKQAAASPSKEKAAASTSAAAPAPPGAGEFVEDAEQVAALTRADERARRLMPTVHHRIVGAAYVQYVREYLSYRGWDEGLPVVTSVAEGKSVALLALAQAMVPPRVATAVRQLARTTLHWLAYSPSLAGALVERRAADPSQVALQRVMLVAGEEAIAPEEGKVGTLKLGRAGMASYALGHVVEANNLEVTCLALEAILTFITLGVMQSNGLAVPSQRTEKALPQLRRYFLAACGMVLVIGASAEEVGRFVRALPSSEGWLLSAALAGGILCCCDVPPSGSGKG